MIDFTEGLNYIRENWKKIFFIYLLLLKIVKLTEISVLQQTDKVVLTIIVGLFVYCIWRNWKICISLSGTLTRSLLAHLTLDPRPVVTDRSQFVIFLKIELTVMKTWCFFFKERNSQVLEKLEQNLGEPFRLTFIRTGSTIALPLLGRVLVSSSTIHFNKQQTIRQES